jgi:hypothetical protein
VPSSIFRRPSTASQATKRAEGGLSPVPPETPTDDSVEVFRRVHRKQVISDENRGGHRPSSASFTNTTGTERMSIALSDTLESLGRAPQTVLDGYEGQLLVGVSVGFVSSLDPKQIVERTPIPEEPAHGDVVGPKPKKLQRQLAREAKWVVGPP